MHTENVLTKVVTKRNQKRKTYIKQ